jgi:nitric oxide reductase subunit B
MRYESQRVAWWFFATSMLLLCLQIVYGFIMGFAHMGFDVLHDTPSRSSTWPPRSLLA